MTQETRIAELVEGLSFSLHAKKDRPSTSSGIRSSFARVLILLAKGWQRGPSLMLPPTCRYAPSCSAYAIEAVERYGAARGSWLALKRILRCHPWGGSGYDPVP